MKSRGHELCHEELCEIFGVRLRSLYLSHPRFTLCLKETGAGDYTLSSFLGLAVCFLRSGCIIAPAHS